MDIAEGLFAWHEIAFGSGYELVVIDEDTCDSIYAWAQQIITSDDERLPSDRWPSRQVSWVSVATVLDGR